MACTTEHEGAGPGNSPHPALPKLCGADVELGNFILGGRHRHGSGAAASVRLLRQIPGTGAGGPSGGFREYAGASDNPSEEQDEWGAWDNCGYGYCQDYGRRFLAANGGCAYIDLSHLELCLPEVLSAFDHLAAWHAMLQIARRAMDRANARMPEGKKIQVLVNNSDGLGNSYGGHLDFLITRRCYDNIFHRKLHQALFLAAYQASSLVFAGAGKVGSENGRPAVGFQLSQRADFYETLIGPQTTANRPLVNSRDESLCGRRRWRDGGGEEPARRMARLHVIFFDSTLCHVACLLKVGVTQIVLAMLEQDCVPNLVLEDPLAALLWWSHDPELQATARLVSGARYTAVDLQEAILERAGQFAARGRLEGLVPEADRILELWAETLQLLKQRDWDGLVGRLDWVLKRCLLERARGRRGLDWNSPALKHLDQIYGSLDPREGLYWTCERSGLVQRLVSPARVQRFASNPPAETRAWLRAHLLRRVEADRVVRVDWDRMRFRLPRQTESRWKSYRYFELPMPNPLECGREYCREHLRGARSLREALERLGGAQATSSSATRGARKRSRGGDDRQKNPTTRLPVRSGPPMAPVTTGYTAPETQNQEGRSCHEGTPETS